jgi:hypothetical protein
VKAYEQNAACNEQSSSYPFLTLCVTYKDCSHTRVTPIPGCVYVIIYTKAKRLKEIIPKESRVSRHNGKTHFSVPDEKEDDM